MRRAAASPHENRIEELMIQKISPKLIACSVSTSSKGSGTASTARRRGSGEEGGEEKLLLLERNKPQKVQCTGPGERGQAAPRGSGTAATQWWWQGSSLANHLLYKVLLKLAWH